MFQPGIWHKCYRTIFILRCTRKALREHLRADCHCIKLAGWGGGGYVVQSLFGTQVKWSHYIVSVRRLITVFLLVITTPLQAESGDWKWSPVLLLMEDLRWRDETTSKGIMKRYIKCGDGFIEILIFHDHLWGFYTESQTKIRRCLSWLMLYYCSVCEQILNMNVTSLKL